MLLLLLLSMLPSNHDDDDDDDANHQCCSRARKFQSDVAMCGRPTWRCRMLGVVFKLLCGRPNRQHI